MNISELRYHIASKHVRTTKPVFSDGKRMGSAFAILGFNSFPELDGFVDELRQEFPQFTFSDALFKEDEDGLRSEVVSLIDALNVRNNPKRVNIDTPMFFELDGYYAEGILVV